jgi:PhnB protein
MSAGGGVMQVTTYLGFGEDCRQAFEFYAKVLGGKIEFLMTYGESPMAAQYPEMKDRVIHASLVLPDGGAIQGADHPQHRAVKPSGFSVAVTVKDPAEAKKIFDALSEGGQVHMAFDKTFWSPGFGMLVDKFQVPWMVNTEGPRPN